PTTAASLWHGTMMEKSVAATSDGAGARPEPDNVGEQAWVVPAVDERVQRPGALVGAVAVGIYDEATRSARRRRPPHRAEVVVGRADIAHHVREHLAWLHVAIGVEDEKDLPRVARGDEATSLKRLLDLLPHDEVLRVDEIAERGPVEAEDPPGQEVAPDPPVQVAVRAGELDPEPGVDPGDTFLAHDRRRKRAHALLLHEVVEDLADAP